MVLACERHGRNCKFKGKPLPVKDVIVIDECVEETHSMEKTGSDSMKKKKNWK